MQSLLWLYGYALKCKSAQPATVQRREELEAQGLEFLEASVQMVPSTTVALDEHGAEKMNRLIDNLNDLDDVMNVYHNWEE